MHGYSDQQSYKMGENNFRFIRDSLQKYHNPYVSVKWFDHASQRPVIVRGPVSRVFRINEVPFVELEHLDYEKALNLGLSTPDVAPSEIIGEALGSVVLATLIEIEVMEALGIGIGSRCEDGPIEINLAVFDIYGCGFDAAA